MNRYTLLGVVASTIAIKNKQKKVITVKNTKQSMKSIFKEPLIVSDKITVITPDYEAIAKVLKEFKELYEMCENKELLMRCLENFCELNNYKK